MQLWAHDSEVQLPFERLHAHGQVEAHAHFGWESRYFSEGRDALAGDSLAFGSVEMGWEHFSGGVWYGYSPDGDYDELQLTIAYTQNFGNWEFYGSYTYLRFPIDGGDDHELGLGLSWSGLPLAIELSADWYYSFEGDGSFAEVSALREFQVSEKLNLGLSATLGVNQGYVSDGHDGANHFALRLGAEYALSEMLSVTAHLSQSWGIGRDLFLSGDELLEDFFHGGVGLQFSF